MAYEPSHIIKLLCVAIFVFAYIRFCLWLINKNFTFLAYSLLGKGWLWGHPLPAMGTHQLAEQEAGVPTIDRQFDEQLALDFIGAWLHVFGELPEKCNVVAYRSSYSITIRVRCSGRSYYPLISDKSRRFRIIPDDAIAYRNIVEFNGTAYLDIIRDGFEAWGFEGVEGLFGSFIYGN